MFYVFVLCMRDMYFMYEINDNNNNKALSFTGQAPWPPWLGSYLWTLLGGKASQRRFHGRVTGLPWSCAELQLSDSLAYTTSHRRQATYTNKYGSFKYNAGVLPSSLPFVLPYFVNNGWDPCKVLTYRLCSHSLAREMQYTQHGQYTMQLLISFRLSVNTQMKPSALTFDNVLFDTFVHHACMALAYELKCMTDSIIMNPQNTMFYRRFNIHTKVEFISSRNT